MVAYTWNSDNFFKNIGDNIGFVVHGKKEIVSLIQVEAEAEAEAEEVVLGVILLFL